MEDKHRVPLERIYWVVPGKLLAGFYPGSDDAREAERKLMALHDSGIRCFVNLMETDEVGYSGKPFVDYAPIVDRLPRVGGELNVCVRFPIPDLNAPSPRTMERILKKAEYSMEMGRPVYVHCRGGIGRTGTVVGCYLIRQGTCASNNVFQTIKKLRRNDARSHVISPETDAQRDLVRSWQREDLFVPNEDRSDSLDEEYSCVRPVMYMLQELQNRGYEKLRFMAYVREDTAFWRCFIGPETSFEQGGVIVKDIYDECVAYHSSGNGTEFFSWQDAHQDTPQALADKFTTRFPRTVERAKGVDREYKAWLDKVIDIVKLGSLPYIRSREPQRLYFRNFEDYGLSLPPTCGVCEHT